MFKLNPFTGLLDEVGSSVAGPGTGDMIAANNLSDLANPATALINLGGTTVGINLFKLTNPSAIRFLRVNADNTVSTLDGPSFVTAIGVTSFSGDYNDLINTPTTLVGYGITDAQPLATILTTLSALANASGALVNNGAGALSYSALGTAAALDVGPAIGQVVQFASTPSTGDAAILFDSASGNKLYLSYEASPGVSSFELVLPLKNGNIVTTGDTGSVTSTMLAGSIAPSKIAGTAAILGANTFTGVQTLPNGTAGAPALNFGDATTGLYRSAANEIGMAISGAFGAKLGASGLLTLADAGGLTFVSGGTNYRIGYVAARGITIFESGSATIQVSNGWTVASGSRYGFSSGAADGATVDTASMREAAQHWTHRNGTTAQILSVSNTWTSTTNFERFKIDWAATANTCRIGTSKGSGGGSARALHLEVGDTAAIKIGTTGLLDFAASVANADVAAVSTHSVPISVAGTIYNFLVRT